MMTDRTIESVACETRDHVAYLTLTDPPLNIMTAAMMDALTDAFTRIHEDRSVKAVAILAEGKAFSAGADVDEHRPEQAPAMIGAFSRLFERLGSLEVPVVALVDGAALGAGFELAMMADVVIATTRAKFGQPEIRLGFIAPVGLAMLPLRVGAARAMEITSSGRTYSADEMREFGLIRTVVEPEAGREALEAVLNDFRKASALIMRMNGRVLKQGVRQLFEDARRNAEAVFLDELMKTADVREGIASFFEKRPPVWTNR